MRDAHESNSVHAMAHRLKARYSGEMNSMNLPRAGHSAGISNRDVNTLDTAYALIRKALERWENEGGNLSRSISPARPKRTRPLINATPMASVP